MNDEIDIQKAISFIYTGGKEYAQAKAEVVYIENFLKSKKAILMKDAMKAGSKSVAAAEIEAYSHKEYMDLLEALKEATEKAEGLRWGITAAQARIDCWRSLEASNRRMDRVTF